MDPKEVKLIKVSDLKFDLDNPRLVEFDKSYFSSEEDMIDFLWENMDVEELVLSMASSGFFMHEPVIFIFEDGENIVIEGNRRLAAAKLILSPSISEKYGNRVQEIEVKEEKRKKLQKIPAIQWSRMDAWQYLGFKHVNGPAKWSSFAKSQYIASVHNEYNIPLNDIARQIGDTHRTVQRLYRGFMVLQQAESLEVFDRNNKWYKHFYFSHLYTGIDTYKTIREFIGLLPETEESSTPVDAEKKEELRELFLWMYGNEELKIEPILKSQNPHLRYLANILGRREAIESLRMDRDIEKAYALSLNPVTNFASALVASKTKLQDAHAWFSEGYDGSEELLETSRIVRKLASDLYESVQSEYTTQQADI